MSVVIDPGDYAPNRLRPLKRAEYDRLVELGFFDDEQVELLAGFLVEMSPEGPLHAHVVRKLITMFVRGLGDRAMVQAGNAIGLSDDSEPQPDLSVVPNGEYVREHPTRALLAIEVSHSSLRKDRRLKARLYARAGIADYWIVNVAERTIEVHRAPGNSGYAAITIHAPGQVLRPLAFPDFAVAVGDVVPPAEPRAE